MNKKVSVIIPVFNEERVVKDCLVSLAKQTYKPLEIIVVDDGSTDKTIEIINAYHSSLITHHLLRQQHKGPGPARNLGASKANGEILVFVDADMTFDKNFIKDLVSPILKGETIGTFSKNEMVTNYENVWSICWNINRNLPKDRMIPQSYPDEASVFRAILKSEFDKVGGFDATGEYTDDWSLTRKLGKKSTVAKGAIYYHSNPATLKEVYKQARWIGKNEFISGTVVRKVRSLILYSFPISVLIGLYKSTIHFKPQFLAFKIIYDYAVLLSIVKSFLNEPKAK